ncbi:MAG: HEAT repeat domain-containing protein, partial [Deltaproteobacteria bacterium]|nr:HEAT repeat domain-containing protein [Deltaproteobacteria bacterium]
EGFATELLDRSTLESEQKALDPDALAELLADGRPVVRANAARGLSVLGGRAAGALGALRVVLKDSRPEVRLAAVEALAALGPAAAELGAADLVSRLGDRHPDVVTAAGEALRAMGEEALPALIAGLDGTARFVSQRLLPALALHGPAAAQALAGALGHGVAQIRARALEGLVVLGRPGATAAREAVAALMEDPASEVRSAAREVLDFIDGKQALSSREAGPMPIEGFDREALGAEVLAKAKLDQEWLAGAVRDGRVMVRRNAAVALGVTGHGREATTALGLALKDGMPEVRRVAASALGTLAAKDAGAAVALVPALADPVERVAEAAREAFAGLGPSGVPALVAALDSGRAAVVDAALAALVAHGEAAVEPLVEVLGEGTVAARFQALRGLDALGVELATAARPAIEAALGHGSRDLRRAARALLDRLDGKGAGPAVFEAALMPVEGFDTGPLDGAVLEEASGAFDAEWLSRALRDGRSAVRANAARALPLCAKGVEARQPLAIALKDAEPEVRQAAAEALARLGRDDDAAIAALVPATFDATPEVGTAARRALEALGDDAVNGLVRALGSPRPQAVLGALELLRTRGKAAVKALLSALNDSSETMRLNAIRALGLVGAEAGEVVGARLLELAEGDPSGRVRRAAASARARIARPEPAARTREPEGFALEGFEERLLEVAALAKAAKSLDVDRLVRALGDGRAVVRANAARGLGVLGKAAHGAVRSLAVLMRDQEPPVRLAAAEALGSLAHEPDIAVVALTRALRDGPESLRPAVLAAVGAFGAAAAEPLMGMLAGVEDEVLATVGRVACHDPKRLVAPLVRQVSEGASPRHREHAIEVLGLVGPEAAAAEGALVEVLADTDSALRARAVRALGKVAKPTKALSERLAALAQSDGSLFVQQAVEQALGDLRRRG